MSMFTRFMKEESGATAIEYGLIAALISVAAILAMTNLGSELRDTFQQTQNALQQGQSQGR